MNPWAIIPLLSCIAYAGLLILVFLQAKTRVNVIFTLFLAACVAWSFSAFMLTSNPSASTQSLIFWNNIVLVAALLSMVIYYHFVRVYTDKPVGIVVYIGYTVVLATLALSLGGFGVRDAYFVDGYLHQDVGSWAIIMMLGWFSLSVVTMWILVQRFRRTTEPASRNKVMYLMVGWGIVMVYSPLNANVPLLSGLPTDHLGTLANAFIITYAISKLQLLDIRFVARRGLGNIIFLAIIGGLYTGAILLALRLLSGQIVLSVVVAVAIVTLLLSALARPARLLILDRIDRLFFRSTYEHRLMLLGFNNRMGNTINLKELADEMLPAITKALHITQARLLFQDTSDEDFTTRFAHPEVEDELSDELGFAVDSPIVAWLDKKERPLDLRLIHVIPEFKGLWATEKEQLATFKLGLFFPVKSRGRLIGIIALGKKRKGTAYTHEDIELIQSMATQASIMIENAQLYTQATIRANTDGLTGLYNHRHFHERLEQETARGSRFGTRFSLIMFDIDLFKAYNDIYGHLAGDQILRRIGGHIRSSIRNLDMPFRYGGEEFTVILPEASSDDAYRVAERIRETIGSNMSDRAMPLTVSLGIASWPADGVMAEEIVACADAALYRAKQTGRNRTCLSQDVGQPETNDDRVDGAVQGSTPSVIYALAATVDAKDHYTYGHSKKVAEYAVILSQALGLSQDRVAVIRTAALLHDMGKIGIPDSVLNKKGALTQDEWAVIKAHPKLGVEILRHVTDLVNCLPAILHHHECYDGTGYPRGLSGSDIPLEARIMAIADAYDAITSLRPYRKKLSPWDALAELKQHAGTQFDAEMVDVFCKAVESVSSKKAKNAVV
ncbi:diguanylate cyclase [Chloroflexota bacterium]